MRLREIANKQIAALLAILACFPNAPVAVAVDRATEPEIAPLIEAYEPNTLGYTNQSDDAGFADIQLSLKGQLLRKTIWDWLNPDERKKPAKDGVSSCMNCPSPFMRRMATSTVWHAIRG